MKLLHQLIKFFWLLIIISVGLGQELQLENNNDGTWNVIYASPVSIAGFQFDVDGATVVSAYGGAAQAAGFMVTASSTTVIGFSLTQATIFSDNPGDTLVVLELTGEPTGLSNMVFSDSDGNAMVFTFIWEGCPDDIACNYDENATIDNGIGSCLYPCSNVEGCLTSDIDYVSDYSLFDCNGNCLVGLDCVGECGGDSTDEENCTGCMDDGYQQWSPNPGSPACNYAQFAIIEGECLYNDCNGDCQEILDNDGNWILNEDFTDTQYDDCGECGGDGSTCSDCNGVPNGSAYLDACSQCVGGDTGIPDCVKIEIESGVLLESDSDDNYIPIFATNLDTLRSLDIEFQYNSNVLQIKDKVDEVGTPGFSLGIILEGYYEIDYENFVVNEDSMKTIFMLYYEPNTEADSVMYFTNVKENIFNIVLETRDIASDITTQIIINKISVNEIIMDDTNWIGGEIMVVVPIGCMDDGNCTVDTCGYDSPNTGVAACNYDPNAREDDGSCEYIIDCFGECGGDAIYDICEVCGGTETDIDNCTCTEENIQYDCIGDCPPNEDCPEEFSFIGGCAQIDECNVCVGGATERYPCEQDCTGEWGGSAYEDNCDVCIIGSEDIDCFRSSFNVYNSNGNIIENDIIPESDTIYVALHMQNLPDSLEGVIIDVDFAPGDLSLIDSKLNPSEFDTGLTIPDLLDSSYVLYFYETSNNGTFLAAIALETANITYQGNDGNILFLQFSNLGNSGDSTVISYNRVLVNEHVMKEQNYTSQVIYFGDCNAVFEGDAYIDECGECVGGNTGIVECDLSNNEYQLIPKDYHLNQNYPNPFNPITYIQYSIPHFDFLTINIININGQIIKTIVQSSHQPGNYEISWDGTNQYGISVPSGIYFYKMNASNFISVRKLVLLK